MSIISYDTSTIASGIEEDLMTKVQEHDLLTEYCVDTWTVIE